MGAIRALTLTLVSALALAPQFAESADFLPAAPMAEPPMLRGTVAPDYSGWYLRGDVGVGATQSRKWTQPATTPAAGTTLTENIRNTSLTDGAFVGVGAGYQFNNWFRADITGEYRGAISAKGTYQAFENSIATPCVVGGFGGACTLYQNNYPGTVQASTFLLNGYFDLGTWHNITPYVGAGVGVSRVSMRGFTDSGVNVTGTGINTAGLPNGASSTVAISPISDKAKWNLSWALMAGLSYDVTSNLKLDLGYRYLNVGRGTAGTINCLCAQTFPGFSINGIASHDFKIGMRWMLNDGPAPVMAQAPMAAPMYAPGPLVRKY